MSTRFKTNEKKRYQTLGVPQEGEGPNVIDKPNPGNVNVNSPDTMYKRTRKYFKHKGNK